jgi:DNA-binding CsgD family transcriptional regulator
MSPVHEGHREFETFDADRQLGVGNVLAMSARSLLGGACLVARVFAVDERGLYEIGASGDRQVRPHDPTIREHATESAAMVGVPAGRPAGFRVAAVAGRARGRVVAIIEVIASGGNIDAHSDDLYWLATVGALAIAESIDTVASSSSELDERLLMADLTARERQILALLGEGATSARIGERLGIRLNTVRTHIQNIRTKLGVSSRLEAAALARRLVVPPLDDAIEP